MSTAHYTRNRGQISSEMITTNITLKPININDDIFLIRLIVSFKVVNKVPCDIILGKDTIAKYNLWHLFNERIKNYAN